ncbi:MAG: urea ABC transporter substrate-binding protein [Isosphaeraceae bacterium]|nr:urea ABC transporter substrate-binding protein [Isosphaeraceae bacterium]
MRSKILLAVGLAALVLAAGAYALYGAGGSRQPIMVGILHSQSGPLAASEKPLIDAEMMAIEEINAAGGLLGRTLKPVVVDGRSSPAGFAEQARRLIDREKVSVIFGGYTSPCRKAMKPVVEEGDHLLVYPTSYEGLEVSPAIVYTGGPANQQITPGVSWCRDVLKAKKFFLVGSDSLYSRASLALVNDDLKALGAKAVGEEYLPPDSKDVAGVVETLQKAAPDVVISTLEGDSNGPFFERLQQAGVTPEKVPVLSFTVSEEELRELPRGAMAGHYGAWNYMESISRHENQEFVRRFKARYGQDRVTCDPVSNAYNGVRFWAQAVTEAETTDVKAVRRVIRRQSLDAPEGVIAIDYENLQAWRAFVLGKIRPDGQFEIVYSLPKPIPPVPFPRTRSRAEWEAFLGELNSRWGGQWSAPAKAPVRGPLP